MDNPIIALNLELSSSETEYLLRALRLPPPAGHQFGGGLSEEAKEATLVAAFSSLQARGLVRLNLTEPDTPALVIETTVAALLGAPAIAHSAMLLSVAAQSASVVSVLYIVQDGAVLAQMRPFGVERFTALPSGESIIAAFLDVLGLDPLFGGLEDAGEIPLPDSLWARPQELDFAAIAEYVNSIPEAQSYASEFYEATLNPVRRYFAGLLREQLMLEGAVLQSGSAYWIVSHAGVQPKLSRGNALHVIGQLSGFVRATHNLNPE